jgi:hypothetical protein
VIPRPGISIDDIDGRLRQLIGTVYTPAPVDYAIWVASAEASLRYAFLDVPLARLYTERYWRLTTGPVMRHHEMLRAEQQNQAEWLERIRTGVSAMIKRFGDGAFIGVLDTHVVMHAKPLSDIDWCDRLEASSVALVVPLRVVDEVDEKKYARRGELQKRARRRLRLLLNYIDQNEIRPAVRVEIVGWRDLDLSEIPRPLVQADVDILDTCEAFRSYAGISGLSMITGDAGMALRCRQRGLHVLQLTDEEMQAGDDENETQSAAVD